MRTHNLFILSAEIINLCHKTQAVVDSQIVHHLHKAFHLKISLLLLHLSHNHHILARSNLIQGISLSKTIQMCLLPDLNRHLYLNPPQVLNTLKSHLHHIPPPIIKEPLPRSLLINPLKEFKEFLTPKNLLNIHHLMVVLLEALLQNLLKFLVSPLLLYQEKLIIDLEVAEVLLFKPLAQLLSIISPPINIKRAAPNFQPNPPNLFPLLLRGKSSLIKTLKKILRTSMKTVNCKLSSNKACRTTKEPTHLLLKTPPAIPLSLFLNRLLGR